jgi:hypothetical protein
MAQLESEASLARLAAPYRHLVVLMLNDAIDDGLLDRSPCRRIELPAAALPVIEPLTPAQIPILADRPWRPRRRSRPTNRARRHDTGSYVGNPHLG